MIGRELVRGAVVDESLLKQPLDGPALGSNITQGLPRRNQFGVVLVELVLNLLKTPRPCRDWVRRRQAALSRDAVSKVGHVLKPHVGREAR